jgi:hypothetical protein
MNYLYYREPYFIHTLWPTIPWRIQPPPGYFIVGSQAQRADQNITNTGTLIGARQDIIQQNIG